MEGTRVSREDVRHQMDEERNRQGGRGTRRLRRKSTT